MFLDDDDSESLKIMTVAVLSPVIPTLMIALDLSDSYGDDNKAQQQQ